MNKFKALSVFMALMVSMGMVSAAYVPEYTSADISTSIIDFLVKVVVGLANVGDQIGEAIGLNISIGLYLALLIMLMVFLSWFIKRAREYRKGGQGSM